ncbi:MAG: hypothetical protein Q9O62_09035 [Ardenticatenia bacterium]|nr:hypothetical protein [Ardenticatenia bacterium]
MEGTIDYETTMDDQYIYYQTWEVTLYPVPFGDAKVEDLSQSEFQSLHP